MLLKDFDRPQIFITLAKPNSLSDGYDFAVQVITQTYMDRTPYEDASRGEVRVRSVRDGYSYANGINHGLMTACAKDCPSLDIVIDPRFLAFYGKI